MCVGGESRYIDSARKSHRLMGTAKDDQRHWRLFQRRQGGTPVPLLSW